MKALIRAVLQKEIKQGMVVKWLVFFVALSLGKGICYFKHYEKLSDKLFGEFIENNFLEILKSSCNPQGMCLFKMVIQVKTPKLLKLL